MAREIPCRGSGNTNRFRGLTNHTSLGTYGNQALAYIRSIFRPCNIVRASYSSSEVTELTQNELADLLWTIRHIQTIFILLCDELRTKSFALYRNPAMLLKAEESSSRSLWRKLKARLVSQGRLRVSKDPFEATQPADPGPNPFIDGVPQPRASQSTATETTFDERNFLDSHEFQWQKSQFRRPESIQISDPAPQPHAKWFALPIEIREIIYRKLYSSMIHIEAIHRRLAHVTCRDLQPGDGWDGHIHPGTMGTEPESPINFKRSVAPNDTIFAFCLTCKLMYVFPSCRRVTTARDQSYGSADRLLATTRRSHAYMQFHSIPFVSQSASL